MLDAEDDLRYVKFCAAWTKDATAIHLCRRCAQLVVKRSSVFRSMMSTRFSPAS